MRPTSSPKPTRSKLRISDPTLDVSGFLIKRLPDGKIVCKNEDHDYHFTVHPGHDSGVLDVHKTREDLPDGHPDKHERVFALGWTDIATILRQFGSGVEQELLSLLRPITIAGIARRRLTVVALSEEALLGEVSSIHIKRRPVNEIELQRWVNIPEFIDDVLEAPRTAAFLIDNTKGRGRIHGLLLTYPRPDGARGLCWVKLSELNQLNVRLQRRLLDAYRAVNSRTAAPP